MAQSIRARNVSEVACSSDVHDSLPRRICCKSPGGICGSFLCTVQRSRTMLKGACRGYYVEDRSPGSDYWLTATNSGSCPFSALLNMPEDETLIFICLYMRDYVLCPWRVLPIIRYPTFSRGTRVEATLLFFTFSSYAHSGNRRE